MNWLKNTTTRLSASKQQDRQVFSFGGAAWIILCVVVLLPCVHKLKVCGFSYKNMYRPNLSDLVDRSRVPIKAGGARGNTRIPPCAPDDLPIHKGVGKRFYPSTLMDSNAKPGTVDSRDKRLVVRNPQVHTHSSNVDRTRNMGDNMGMHLRNVRPKRRSAGSVYSTPDTLVSSIDAEGMRTVFNSYSPWDPVHSFPVEYNNTSGLMERQRDFPSVVPGGGLPHFQVGSMLEQNPGKGDGVDYEHKNIQPKAEPEPQVVRVVNSK